MRSITLTNERGPLAMTSYFRLVLTKLLMNLKNLKDYATQIKRQKSLE